MCCLLQVKWRDSIGLVFVVVKMVLESLPKFEYFVGNLESIVLSLLQSVSCLRLTELVEPDWLHSVRRSSSLGLLYRGRLNKTCS